MRPKEFIRQLLVVAPGFAPSYREHINDYEELLPHVLLGDFTRWLIDRYRERAGDPNGDEWQGVIDFLEAAFASGDRDTRNLIGASFVENLHQADADYEGLKHLLGPTLREQLVRIE